ncbi:hypothetical protein T492DRAFT_860787 [Pavlovales sp. CCMP2436]|nr:hypothetical protein T492DRAFT_860787 [Pavlovales sp. CCMP2436]
MPRGAHWEREAGSLLPAAPGPNQSPPSYRPRVESACAEGIWGQTLQQGLGGWGELPTGRPLADAQAPPRHPSTDLLAKPPGPPPRPPGPPLGPFPGPPAGLAAEPVLPPRRGCRASLTERTSPPLLARGPAAHLGGGGDALAPGGPRGAARLGAYEPPGLSQWGGGAWPAGSRLPALPDAPGLGGGALTGAVGLSRLNSSDLACLFAPDLPGLGGAGGLAGGPAGVAAAARTHARASSEELPAFFLTGLSRSREDPAFGAIEAEALSRQPPSRSDTESQSYEYE